MTEDLPPDNPAALTSFIEARYHARHREQLPDLTALASPSAAAVPLVLKTRSPSCGLTTGTMRR